MSAAFYIKIEQTKAFLVQGQVGLAQSILNELDAETKVENRWRDHYLGIIKMRLGSFDQAITLFLNTLSKNGYHLSVILDLASCYHQTGQMYNWQKMIDLAYYEYKNNHEKLSQAKKIQTGILLAKFIEEKGLVSEALDMYADLLKLAPENDIRGQLNPDYVKISAQILRLHGQYSLKNDVSATYQLLCSHNASNSNVDSDFEIQHALMIYELSFFGAVVCWTRYKRITQNPLAQSFELNWIQSDLFYGFLARGFKDQAFQILTHFTTPQNIFTQTVRQILQTKDLDLEKYMDCVTHITTAAHLRLLKIWSLYSENTMSSRRQKMLIDLYSKKTKIIWASYFNLPIDAVDAIETKSVKISLELIDSVLKVASSDQKLKLSKNSNEIMNLFNNKNQIPLADVFKLLWNSEGTDSDISRLRMRVSRLNSLLHSKLGITNCMQLDKTHLKLNYSISQN